MFSSDLLIFDADCENFGRCSVKIGVTWKLKTEDKTQTSNAKLSV